MLVAAAALLVVTAQLIAQPLIQGPQVLQNSLQSIEYKYQIKFVSNNLHD